MAAFQALLADVASDGKHVVLGMLAVGGIFIGVIALGQFAGWMSHRKGR